MLVHVKFPLSMSQLNESKTILGRKVYGLQLNEHTGCAHYASELDVIAIKFKCCQRYYACYTCHLAGADHSAERWQHDDYDVKAILCGHCGVEMTIRQYLSCNNQCVNCHSPFNPGCKLHWHLYFDFYDSSKWS